MTNAQMGNRLREIRKSKGLSLKKLAKITGTSISYLSMVENGKVDPSFSKLKSIVESLGVAVINLFQPDTGMDVVVRADYRSKGNLPESKTDIEILVPPKPEIKRLNARLAIIHPGGGSAGEYAHAGEEFGYVLKGRLNLGVDRQEYTLTEGDSFFFVSERPHYFRNDSDEDAHVIWINQPPPL